MEKLMARNGVSLIATSIKSVWQNPSLIAVPVLFLPYLLMFALPIILLYTPLSMLFGIMGATLALFMMIFVIILGKMSLFNYFLRTARNQKTTIWPTIKDTCNVLSQEWWFPTLISFCAMLFIVNAKAIPEIVPFLKFVMFIVGMFFYFTPYLLFDGSKEMIATFEQAGFFFKKGWKQFLTIFGLSFCMLLIVGGLAKITLPLFDELIVEFVICIPALFFILSVLELALAHLYIELATQ